MVKHLLGHCLSLQPWVSDVSPVQSDPPYSGAGSVHVRARDLVPSPHVTEQDSQAPHAVNPPSAINIIIINCCSATTEFKIDTMTTTMMMITIKRSIMVYNRFADWRRIQVCTGKLFCTLIKKKHVVIANTLCYTRTWVLVTHPGLHCMPTTLLPSVCWCRVGTVTGSSLGTTTTRV